MDNYEKGKKVGHGTYGIVYKGLHKSSQKDVALKKIMMANYKDGVSFTAIREIKTLQELHHENVVALMDVFVHSSNVFLVFEFMDHDLEQIINDKNVFLSPADIKSYMFMLMNGVEYLHRNWILHRDLKPNNLLISQDGIVKIADFGFARHFGSPNPRFTPQICTRWYRAPELLYGAKIYGTAIDMWSIGCIFAEMMLRVPYFSGESDIDQLSKIFAGLGTPTEEIWPGMTLLPDYVPFNQHVATPFKMLFTAARDEAIDLLAQLLRYNPNTRITAADALKHPYFHTGVQATPPDQLPKPSGEKSALAGTALSGEHSPVKRDLFADSDDKPPSSRRKLNEDEDMTSLQRKLF